MKWKWSVLPSEEKDWGFPVTEPVPTPVAASTNGPTAEWCIVFAITDTEKAARKAGGISAFLVPTDSKGFAVESVVRLFGHAGGHEGALVLEDVEVGHYHDYQ